MVADKDGHGWHDLHRRRCLHRDRLASISSISRRDDRHQLLEEGPALPYRIRPGAKTLVIGPGGGWDVVARARLRQPGRHRGRNQPHHRHHDHARAVRRSSAMVSTCGPTCTSTWRTGAVSCAAAPQKYQVIQATLVDTWASTAAGAFALSENNLYTTDAMRDYLEHLTDDGIDRIHPLGSRPAARVAAAGGAGGHGARGNWARASPGAMSSWCGPVPPRDGARSTP